MLAELPLLNESAPLPAITPAQGEFQPATSLQSFLRPWQRAGGDAIKLETGGVTSHSQRQAELFDAGLLLKASIVAKLMEIGAYDLAEPLARCHTEQGFAQCVACTRVKPFWNRCDLLVCPTCQPRLAAERYESIQWWTEQVPQPKHIVLTMRNADQITFRWIRWAKSALARLRRSKLARNWRGGLWTLEVTNEGRGWHLHFHLLVDVSWVDPGELARKWGQLIGQDYAIVKVKDARPAQYRRDAAKYVCKGTELASWSGPDIVSFLNALHGNRTFGVFGSLYGKRTQWREWLDTLISCRQRCDCGANHWKVYSAEEWEAHCILHQTIDHKPIPPPAHTINPQRDFLVALAR